LLLSPRRLLGFQKLSSCQISRASECTRFPSLFSNLVFFFSLFEIEKSSHLAFPRRFLRYSDSDDEDRDSSKQALPSWAQSPEIRNALREQESHNPDDIFGPMKPLSMEEVFRARAGKFRARSSSANWGGTDRLTPQEESDYARRMGFK